MAHHCIIKHKYVKKLLTNYNENLQKMVDFCFLQRYYKGKRNVRTGNSMDGHSIESFRMVEERLLNILNTSTSSQGEMK